MRRPSSAWPRFSLTTGGSRKLNPWCAEGWSWMAAPGTGRAGTGPDGAEPGGDCPENCRRSAQAQSRLPTTPSVAGQHPHSEARLPRAVGGSGHVPEARAERPHERSGSPDTRESPTGPGQCDRARHRRSAQALIPMVSRMHYTDFASAGEGPGSLVRYQGLELGRLVGRRAWENGGSESETRPGTPQLRVAEI